MTGKIEIMPVTWSGNKVLKYRASVVFDDSSVMSGDPMPTEDAAVQSLTEACKAWTARVKIAKEKIKEYEKANEQ